MALRWHVSDILLVLLGTTVGTRMQACMQACMHDDLHGQRAMAR